MRLGTCVAFELVVGIGTAAGIATGAFFGGGYVRDTLQREAEAASLRRAEAAELEAGVPGRIHPLERPHVFARRPPAPGMFNGVRDELLLAPLRDSPIKRVKFNHGGSSISLRVELENGAMAAFKPEQTNYQTIPRREIAAFRINRLVGLSTVAPAMGRAFRESDILAHLTPSSVGYAPRLQTEMIEDSRGYVAGEMSWWIPVITQAKIGGYRIDDVDGIVTWKRFLTIGREIPPEDFAMAGQISNMVLFDHLINNSDRWSGGNARASADGHRLYFMDNTLSFGLSDEGHERTVTYLMRSQKFSRHLVRHLRELSFDQVKQALSTDKGPYEYLLSDEEIRSMLARRDFALAYIDELIELHGKTAVLAFP